MQTRRVEDVYIIDLLGKLIATTERSFWEVVQQLVVDEGARKLVVNFEKVPECDSYAISELLRVHRSIDNIKGRMVLVEMNDLIQKVFSLTKVDTVFHIAATVDDAIEDLRDSSPQKTSI
ncbi:MAG: STAS domain-containing protein [Bacteroidota bacterium]